MENKTKRLTELTKSILDVTSIERLGRALKKETFNLGEEIRDQIDEFSARYGGTSRVVFFPLAIA